MEIDLEFTKWHKAERVAQLGGLIFIPVVLTFLCLAGVSSHAKFASFTLTSLIIQFLFNG